jgi:PTS system nitrogen regulatory IIA component
MTNTNIIEFDSILMDFKSANIKETFSKLSAHIHRIIGTSEKTILNHLLALEKEQGSGIGKGVAIPHMRLPRLTRPLTVFAKLSSSVDFEAADGEPVDMVCLILSPEYEGPKHLQRLSMVTRFMNDTDTLKKLRSCEDKDDVRMVLKQKNNMRAAA